MSTMDQGELMESWEEAVMEMKTEKLIGPTIGLLGLLISAQLNANTYGSVEPVANPAVIDTEPLRLRSLAVREAFAERLFHCGIVDDVLYILNATGAISSINPLNTDFDVTAGGFQGNTNPAYAYTIIDSGPNAASFEDIAIMTDALGYVLSQGSAFLLDADDSSSFDFPANYVVLNFDGVPSIEESADLFETVGAIDPDLFETDSSGYTQFGRAYLSLQSFVPDQQFIDGYVEAAEQFGVEYTPVTSGVPGLFNGGAGFPTNDWTVSTEGEDYLVRIPSASHGRLGRLRNGFLKFTRKTLRKVEKINSDRALRRAIRHQRCPR